MATWLLLRILHLDHIIDITSQFQFFGHGLYLPIPDSESCDSYQQLLSDIQ